MPIKLNMRSLLIILFATTSAAQMLTSPEEGVPASLSTSQTISADHSPQHQDKNEVQYVAPSWWPHPYAEFAGTDFLRPAGYSPVAPLGQVGVDLERSPWLADAHFSADSHKANASPFNPSGHNLYLSVSGYRRIPHHMNWFAGVGWEWNQVSSTNASASGGYPFFGGGYDLLTNYKSEHPECVSKYCNTSIRLTLSYFTARVDPLNDERGIDFGFILPRPVEKRHLFIAWDMLLFWHGVVPSVPTQTSTRVFGDKTSIGVVYRFH